MLHLLNVYGYPNNGGSDTKDKIEALVAEAFAYATALGSVPVLVLGYFNTTEQRSKVLAWIERGGTWTDLCRHGR